MKIHLLSITALRQAFIEGDLSAIAIAEHFLKRIEQYDPLLGAFLSVMAPQVLMRAEQLDKKRAAGRPLGKLAAVPVAIKDNMHIAGEVTSCASQFLAHYKAPFDATAIRHLLEEDALLIGKTNLDEFSMGSSNENSSFKKAANPWNMRRVPGGSSGGSSASVAARLAPLALGSDTGGSVRQPASFCGVVGYKPTYGRVSRYGLVAFASSLDQIGPIATTVEDIGIAMEILGRHCEKDSTSLALPPETYLGPFPEHLKNIQIGVPTAFLEDVRPDLQAGFLKALDVLKSLGAQLVEIDLSILKYSIATYYILATAEASTNLARFDGIRYGTRSKRANSLEEIYEFSREEGFGREVKKRILLGTFVLSAGYQDAYYKKAQKVRTLILSAFEKAFARCDAIALPSTTGGAFEHGVITDPVEMYLQDLFTVPANLAGLPAITVPSGFDENQMPLGLQLIGPQLCDVPLVRYARCYEKASGYKQIIPPGFS